ncbi:two-component system sensor kinase [Neisseria gonorrhoeae]|uniref:histidine kinase n=1 Tax=Neisseria gonorrhoeae TaxID=485 RepID=A0A378W0I4_NEIGO|nr:two-component system sensor kinase [Neisseria gonorrhoeae]
MRSPLARMQAIVGLIQAQPQKREQYLKRLEGELTRMDTLAGELLTLSRLETSNMALEKESLKLLPFLGNLVEDNQSIAQKNGQTVALSADGKIPETQPSLPTKATCTAPSTTSSATPSTTARRQHHPDQHRTRPQTLDNRRYRQRPRRGRNAAPAHLHRFLPCRLQCQQTRNRTGACIDPTYY